MATGRKKRQYLTLVMTDELKKIDLQHIDQTNESDLNLLVRISKQNGAEMAIKKDRLLIFKAGSAKTASGKDLPSITITRNDGDQFRYSEQYRDSDYTGVSTSYHDSGKAERASAAKMAEIKRQMAKFSINLAYGLPEITTESNQSRGL